MILTRSTTTPTSVLPMCFAAVRKRLGLGKSTVRRQRKRSRRILIAMATSSLVSLAEGNCRVDFPCACCSDSEERSSALVDVIEERKDREKGWRRQEFLNTGARTMHESEDEARKRVCSDHVHSRFDCSFGPHATRFMVATKSKLGACNESISSSRFQNLRKSWIRSMGHWAKKRGKHKTSASQKHSSLTQDVHHLEHVITVRQKRTEIITLLWKTTGCGG